MSNISDKDANATFYIVMSMVVVVVAVAMFMSARDASRVCVHFEDHGGNVVGVEALAGGVSPPPKYFWVKTRRWMTVTPETRKHLTLTGDGWCR